MVDTAMHRRTVLCAAGVAVTGSVSGCLDRVQVLGENGTPERPWEASTLSETPEGVHHLYVVNRTETRMAAWIRVVRNDGAAIVDGRYELPATGGLEFGEIGAWETSYTIKVALDGRERISRYWSIATCGEDTLAPGDKGSRNGTLRILTASAADDGERATFVTDQCDQIHKPAVPTGPAEGFRLDEQSQP